MSNRERIFEYITNHPGLDDDELSSMLEIFPRQTVNIICRKLEIDKLITRTKTDGKIRNFPSNVQSEFPKVISKPDPAVNPITRISMDEEATAYFEELGFLIELKKTVSPLNNKIHGRTVRLALKYLKHLHSSVQIWDTKEGSDSGVDIEGKENGVITVVGEIKTTIPYYTSRLGAAQMQSIKKDFEKMQNYDQASKYFFVLDNVAYNAVTDQFQDQFANVKILAIEDCYS